MAQSQSRPLWRVVVDSADRVLGPASEQLVRTDAFADAVGIASRARHAAVTQVQRRLRQHWHRWNLPAGSDVKRLSEQVASLERQVRDLSRQLEERDRPAARGARSGAGASSRTARRDEDGGDGSGRAASGTNGASATTTTGTAGDREPGGERGA
jgi:hypothetical protein